MHLNRKRLAIAFFASVAVFAAYVYRSRDIPFTSNGWKSNLSERPRMVSDLIAKGKLDGVSRADVDTILGVPDSIRGDKYIYWAGTDGVIDDMWLEVTFADDRVVDVRHVPD